MIKYGIMSIHFLLEILALLIFGYWGFHVTDQLYFKVVLGIGVPLLTIIVWGTFLSPKAKIPLHRSLRILGKLLVFGLAAVALYTLGNGLLGEGFFLISIIAIVLENILKI